MQPMLNQLITLLPTSSQTFTSTQTREIFTMFHQVTCHSYFIYYQNVSCARFSMLVSLKNLNIGLKITRKTKIPNAIEACKHFNNNRHKFSKHGKFIIIEHSRIIRLKERKILDKEMNFWINLIDIMSCSTSNVHFTFFLVHID